jgi:hypothetical protein
MRIKMVGAYVKFNRNHHYRNCQHSSCGFSMLRNNTLLIAETIFKSLLIEIGERR